MSSQQTDWRWCKKCQELFFSGVSLGVCPAGGSHDPSGSINYKLTIVDGNEGINEVGGGVRNARGYFLA